MTNWPNIQEYRNFEAKFHNDSFAYEGSNEADSDGEMETVGSSKPTDHEDWVSEPTRKSPYPPEPKTVRCVITKDFEEAFKKLDRGDGLSVSQREGGRPKSPEIHQTSAVSLSGLSTDRRSIADQVRLENHLKWKRQKEEEYLQKKMAEKLAVERQKEEETRLEKLKKQKERERETKLREWLEQKEREKEGKKREKFVMKVLEEELKDIPPVIDKEKLIENWVRLKDKQRQLEAEKRAEMQKREEESRALRQSLAALSYRQWKEKVKGKNTTLPKNGYQIFGPKPVPVVKEDWDHNFTRDSPRRRLVNVVGSRSNTTTNLTISSGYQMGPKEGEDQGKTPFHLGSLKGRSPSFYHLKNVRSGSDFTPTTATPPKQVNPTIVASKKTSGLTTEGIYARPRREITVGVPGNFPRRSTGSCDFTRPSFSSAHQEQNSPTSPPGTPRVVEHSVKKKIDLYIDPLPVDDDEDDDNDFAIKFHKKPKPKLAPNARQKKKDIEDKSNVVGEKESKTKTNSKRPFGSASRRHDATRTSSEAQITRKTSNQVRHTVKKSIQQRQSPTKTTRAHRRSKSCDKPQGQSSKENVKEKTCAGSRSMMKLTAEKKVPGSESKTRTSLSQRRRVGKSPKPSSAGERDVLPVESKSNSRLIVQQRRRIESLSPKKPKKKMSKSFDSPYSVKRTSSKGTEKSKASKRKSSANKDDEEGKRREPEKRSSGKILQ